MSEDLKVICVFCNAVQSAKVQAELGYISQGCETCGYGGSAEFTIEIRCEACDKVIYKKEYEESN